MTQGVSSPLKNLLREEK